MGTALWTVIVWLVLGGFYLFLAGEISTVETIAGLVCTSVGTALAFGLVRVAHRRFRFRPAPRAILRPLVALLSDISRFSWLLYNVIVWEQLGILRIYILQTLCPVCWLLDIKEIQ